MRVLGRACLYLVLAMSVFLLFVAFDLKPELGDEGILSMDAWRICKGEVPQRDFFQFIPPLAAYIQAAFFKMLGPSVFSIRLLGLVYGLIVLTSVFFLYRRFISSELILALSLVIIVPHGVSSWEFGSHHWLCTIFQVLGAILLLSGLKNRSYPKSVTAGVLFGLAVLTLQDQGGYAVIGLAIAAFFIPRNSGRMHFLAAIGTACFIFLLAAILLALVAGPAQLFMDWVYFPLFYYKMAQGNQFILTSVFNQFAALWSLKTIKMMPIYGICHPLVAHFLLLLPVLAPVSLYLIWVKKAEQKAELLVITVFAGTFLLTSLHRFALTNLIWSFGALLPFYILIDRILTKGSKLGRTAAASLACLLILATAGYSWTKIGVCLDKKNMYLVKTSAGSYRFFEPYSARSLQQLVDAIDINLPEEEPMFCAGYIPLVNFLTRHPNPTKLNFVYFGGYYSKQQVILWSETLERKKIVWGISARETINETNAGKLIPDYRMVFSNDRYVLWKRK